MDEWTVNVRVKDGDGGKWTALVGCPLEVPAVVVDVLLLQERLRIGRGVVLWNMLRKS